MSSNSNYHSPHSNTIKNETEDDIGNNQLIRVSQLLHVIADNQYAIKEHILREADYIKKCINDALSHISKLPCVIQVMLSSSPFAKEAWAIVEQEIHKENIWEDYQVIVQDERFIYIIIQNPTIEEDGKRVN